MTQTNRVCAITPVVMSLLALLIALIVIFTGWERNLTDEGAAAHTFQLLIVAQTPFVLGYLVTADWARPIAAIRPFSMQILAVGVAIGAVALFRL